MDDISHDSLKGESRDVFSYLLDGFDYLKNDSSYWIRISKIPTIDNKFSGCYLTLTMILDNEDDV